MPAQEQVKDGTGQLNRPPSMPWYTGLQFRMYTSFLLLIFVMIGGTVGVALMTVRKEFLEDAHDRMGQTGDRIVAELGQRMVRAESVLHSMVLVGSASDRRADATGVVSWILATELLRGRIMGAGIWYEPGGGDARQTCKVWRGNDERMLVAVENPEEQWEDYARTDWYQGARLARETPVYWSLPYVDPFTGVAAVSCAAPVRGAEGDFLGVVTVDLPVSKFEQGFNSFMTLPDGYVFLADQHNRLFFPLPGKGRLNGNDTGPFPSLGKVAEQLPGFRPVAQALERVNDYRILPYVPHGEVVDRARERLKDGLTGVQYPNAGELMLAVSSDPLGRQTQTTRLLDLLPLESDPVMDEAALAAIFHVPGAYWRVVVVEPEAKATAMAQRVALRVLLLMLLLVLFPMLVAFLLVRRDLIRPLRQMRRYLTGLAETEGDFLQGLGDTAPGELVELAYAFNQRTNALRATNVQLREEMAVRERAQIALRESEARFRNVLENTRDMLYQLNLETQGYEYVSPASLQITGFSSGELHHMAATGVRDLIHPDDRENFEAHTRQLVESEPGSETAHEVEFRLQDKSGKYLWASENRTLVRNEAQQPVAIVASLRDVTERRHAEEEMAHMRRYLQNIIDSMPSVIIGVNGDGRVTHWNQEAVRVTELTPGEAEGRLFEEVLNLPKEYHARVREAIQTGEPMKAERFSTRDAEGELLTCDLIVYPLGANSSEGAVIRIDDVSARVQIEELMVQTEKMMSVGGLAAGMAHEINNPLGGILQACQNIDRRTSAELRKNVEVAESLGTSIDTVRAYLNERGILEFIGGIKADGARAAKIVADMLAFSRQSESRFAPVDLADMVDSVIRLAANDYDLKKHYDFRQIEILREFDPEVREVRCEKTKIQQVLLNLIKNAAQAMAENPGQEAPRLTISAKKVEPYVELEVADNGPGMDEDTRRRAFEPFFTTKEVGVGTGLGLSVSYFIITKHHRGAMSVESAPGEGARFIIRLPLELGV